MENWAKLLESIAKLVGSIAWPGVAIYLIIRFGSTIKEFLSNLSEGSVKGFGFEASARRAAAEAIADADAKAPTSVATDATSESGSGKAVRLADFVTSSVPLRQLKDRTILWVDDNPDNNKSERIALTALGLNLFITTTTQSALNMAVEFPYDVIISDMKRGNEGRAGYDLLASLKKAGVAAPFIIYSSTNTPQQEAEARSKGAFGSTNSATDLIILIADALRTVGKADFGHEYKRRYRELRNYFSHMNTQ